MVGAGELSMPITLKEVAQAAGVHISTASAVLNAGTGNTRVAETTRDRVLRAAESLGYQVNVSARRLRTGSSEAVGFLGGDLRNPFFAELAALLEQGLATIGRTLVIAHVSPGRRNERAAALAGFHRQTIRTALLWDEHGDVPPAPEGMRVLPFGFTAEPRPGVWLDLAGGINALVVHLAGRSHRRLGLFLPASLDESPSVAERRRVFTAACRRHALPPPAIYTYPGESWDVSAATDGAQIVLRHRDCDAIVGFNDVAALGLLLARQGFTDAPLIVGFDSTPLLRAWPGGITRLDLHLDALLAALIAALTAANLPAGRRDAWIQPSLLPA